MAETLPPMRWRTSYRYDPAGVALADRHYNRRKHGSPQFVPPGRNLVFVTTCEQAVWVTSWPYARYVRHAWGGAWVNTIFRNEGAGLSSELIREALAATLWTWEPPALGCVSFINADKVRRKRDPGRCYRKAGFHHVGYTKRDGLWVYQLPPEEMPAAVMPVGAQSALLNDESPHEGGSQADPGLLSAAAAR